MGLMDSAGAFGRPADFDGERGEGRVIGALDLGSSKIACLIGRADPEGEVALMGVGAQRPQAGPDGAPLDFEACVRAIKIAVDHAERMAGETITAVVTAYGGPGLKARRLAATVPLPPGPIGPRSVRAAIAASRRLNEVGRHSVLHAVTVGYRIDGGALLADPRGFEGRELSAELMVVSAPETALSAIKDCVAEAGLRAAKIVAAPYAAGLAVLSPEERQLGAVVMDCGANHVGLAAFQDGRLVLASHAAIGGAAVTKDIATAIGTSFAAAERLKLVHGGFGKDRPEQFEAARIGPEGRLEPMQLSRARLIEAFGPKLEAMLVEAGAKLQPLGGLECEQPWRCALTGGASQMAGAKDLAQTLLRRPVRSARPVGFGVLDEAAAAPAYAVAAGLLRFEAERGADALAEPEAPEPARARRPLTAPQLHPKLGKAWDWFKENF